MADFLSNLILRSTSPQAPDAVFQPRLPSLFESPRGAAELPMPAADLAGQEASTSIESPAPAAADPAPAEQRREGETPAAAVRGNSAAPVAAPGSSAPSAEGSIPAGQQNKSTLRVEQSATRQHTPLPAERLDEVSGAQRSAPATQPSVTPAAPFRRSLAPQHTILPQAPAQDRWSDSRPATPTGGSREVSAPADATPLLAPARDGTSTPASSATRRESAPAFKSKPAQVASPDRPQPASPAVLPMPQTPRATVQKPAAPRVSEAADQEPVVQIHIGRIEVRAVAPPAPASAARPAAAAPKVSLDEYLRNREDRR